MKKGKRLLWQLFGSYLIISFLALLAVTWYTLSSLKTWYFEQKSADLEVQALLLERHILENLSPEKTKIIDGLCKKIGQRASTRITVILPSGKVIGDSEEDPSKMDNHRDRPEVKKALTGPIGKSARHSRTLEKEMIYTGIPVKNNDTTVAVIRTSMPLNDIEQAINTIQEKIAVGGVIAVIMSAFFSLLLSRSISLPIEQIRRWAASIAEGKFDTQAVEVQTEELKALSDSLNHMAIQLKQRIDTISQQKNEIRAMLSSMSEGVIAVDREERIINMNQAAAQMFSCNPNEAKGRSVQEVIRNSLMHQFVKEVLVRHEPIEKEIVVYSGGERYLNGHGTELISPNKEPIGALIVLNDISRLRKLENIRKEFVANVSHEIKTPVTAIKGFVETLIEGQVKDPAETEKFLNIIRKHVERLESLIEGILDLSRIEREYERNDIILTKGNVGDVIINAVEICRETARDKNIDIHVSGPENSVAKINAQLLELALTNLIDNAVKYSEEKSTIQVETSEADGKLTINVKDFGCGIKKEHIPRLFERFYRVDKSRSRTLGGTGLGLAIVKHIVQAHGGTVSVVSFPGKGSTFRIHLPTP